MNSSTSTNVEPAKSMLEVVEQEIVTGTGPTPAGLMKVIDGHVTENGAVLAERQMPFDIIVRHSGERQNEQGEPAATVDNDSGSESDQFLDAVSDVDSETSASQTQQRQQTTKSAPKTKAQHGGGHHRNFSWSPRSVASPSPSPHNNDMMFVQSHFHYARRRVAPTNGQLQSSPHRLLNDDELLPPVEVDEELEVDIDEEMTVCFPALDNAKEQAGNMMKRFWAYSTRVTNFNALPEWMQDNDFLHTGHRVPMPTVGGCLRSIFALHTETGNIWTHLLGCVAFIGVACWFLTRPSSEVQWQEKVVFSAFFLGAIGCLAMSTAFHTMSCHSHEVGKMFGKLDYVGISLLIVGSFIPWLYYGFYCRRDPKIVYTVLICVLGAGSIVVSLFDRFGTPKYRPVRAGMFIGTGLSGVIPCIHYIITDGFMSLIEDASFHWMALMAVLYIGGALLYAFRVPERFFPGKCDIWFQSHQIFHLCVIVAAVVHYHGISEMAHNRLNAGSCAEQYPSAV